MPKKSVQKQKMSKTRTKRRFATWVRKIQTKLQNRINLVTCEKCGEQKLSHTACQNCGTYRGRQALKVKEPELKTTKLKV